MNSNTSTPPADLLAQLDFEPDEQHAVADMANVGYSLMQAIARHLPGYVYNDSPAEIVGDLMGDLDDLRKKISDLTGAAHGYKQELNAAIESLAAHRGEAALWVNLEQLAAARHDIAQHRMSYVRAWNTDYPPEGATQPLYDHPPQAQAVNDEFGRRPIAWAVQSKAYGLCYSFSNEFIEAFPNAPVNYVVAQAGAGDIEAMVDCMARVVAEHAGEDFDTIGQFAQSILLDTQRAALLAALEAKP